MMPTINPTRESVPRAFLLADGATDGCGAFIVAVAVTSVRFPDVALGVTDLDNVNGVSME